MKSSRTHSFLNILTFFAMLVSLLGSAVSVISVRAAMIITVNTNADNTTDDGLCTLREAITAANTNTAVNGADDCNHDGSAGTDTITFAGNYTITLTGSQLPAVDTAIVITGNGAANTIIQADALPNTATYRVIEVTSAGSLTLDNLTIRNGKCNGSCPSSPNNGGGIYNNGTLTVSNSTISNNYASNFGGGIYNYDALAVLAVTDSTISFNSAIIDGGGVNSLGTLSVTNSAITHNNANVGGGGIYSSGALTMTDGTISHNSANNGGGLYNFPLDSSLSVTVTGSTFSDNSATVCGGGMYIRLYR